MAWALTITCNNTTLNLNDGSNYRLMGFNPASNGIAETTGQEIRVQLLGSSQTALGAAENALTKIFDLARRYQASEVGYPVYLNYTPDGYGAARRSEIKDGLVLLDEDSQRYYPFTKNRKVMITIVLERDNFWEGSETGVVLVNPNTPGGTATGVRVYNCNDGSGTATPLFRHNYVEIGGSMVTGGLPAPAQIVMEYTAGGTASQNLRDVFVAQNVFSAPESFLQYVEGEQKHSGAGAAAGLAGASGGTILAVTMPANIAGTAVCYLLSNTIVGQVNGNYLHVVGMASSALPSNTLVRLQATWGLYEQSQSMSWKQPDINNAGRTALDFGVIKVPPGLKGVVALDFMKIYIWFRNAAGGTVNLDWIGFMPVDGYRYYRDPYVGNGEKLIDDGIVDEVYNTPALGLYNSPVNRPYGERIFLTPGVVQRLYFCWDSYDIQFRSLTSDYLTVRVVYRPRYRTI